ncbi:MAG: Oligoendopeptidase F, plasmid [Firmicutes bacterium ADurb.Bin506]|nr:MAG: Oligoendopeptidase F, plasmid [Firmicutes bacterium ADurb.Bin506]
MSEAKAPSALPNRADVPDELKWRLEHIYGSDHDWEADMSLSSAEIPKLAAMAGTLGSSAANLYKALSLRDSVAHRIERLYVYSRMRRDEDNANPKYQAMSDRAASLAVQAQAAASFIAPEVLSIAPEVLDRFFSDMPELDLYRHFLDDITRRRAHTLSVAEERIVAQAAEVGQSVGAVFTMLNNADIKFPSIIDEHGNTVEVTKGRYLSLMESRDRRVRKEAFEALYSSYRSLINTIAATYSASVKHDTFNARVHSYPDSVTSSLDQFNIPVAVYDNLVEAIRRRMPSMHRYVALRKRALGVDELHMYDVYTPIVPAVEWKVSYEEARSVVIRGLSPLGSDYVDIMAKGMEDGWVDVVESRGKTAGAYSWGVYGTHPYVLLNWNDTLDNMFTLAHEMGHAMHSHYSWSTQPYVYGEYPIFLAEVASTVNEVLLLKYLLGVVDDPMRKLYLLNHFLESFRGTMFRQTMFAEFERNAHKMHEEGQALTPQVLGEMYRSLNGDYFGPEMVLDDEIALEWARIPHFYTAFYVYQYATGFASAVAIADALLTEGEPARQRYIEFLKGGGSAYPLDLLKKAGVDMTTADPVLRALGVFESTVEEMESFFNR